MTGERATGNQQKGTMLRKKKQKEKGVSAERSVEKSSSYKPRGFEPNTTSFCGKDRGGFVHSKTKVGKERGAEKNLNKDQATRRDRGRERRRLWGQEKK